MLIIDGTYLVYKSYYVTEKIKGSYGVLDTGHYQKIARNIFLKLLSKVKTKYNPKHLFIVFDCEGTNFRHELLPSYKANRKDKPEEIFGIKDEIYNFLEVHNFSYQIGDHVEGDDLIASFTHQYPQVEKMVFTGDADLAALVNNHTTLLLEKKKKVQKITIQNFHRFFPTPPALFADFKSLQGDKSDFLKGVDGLFRTEALHLLMEYGSVENYFENGNEHYLFDKIIAEKDKVLVNKKVAQLKYDCPINVTFEHTNVNHIYLPEKIASKVGWH